MNRSTLKAGTMKAGDPLADDAPLAELLQPRTIADADAALVLLESRREGAEAAVAAHASTRDDALLAGTEADHDAETQRLADDARRLTVAAERVIARRKELAAADRLAEGKRHAATAIAAASRAEALVGEYTTASARVAELLAEIEAGQLEVIRERSAAREAGVECDAQLPHESRFRAPQYEERETVTRQRAPGVYDAAGHRMGNNTDPDEVVSRRVERVMTDPGHRPMDLAKARAFLPAIDGGVIVDRNRDA